MGAEHWSVEPGDLFVVPSWEPFATSTESGIDLFRFGDAPVFEALHLQREQIGSAAPATTAAPKERQAR